MVYTCYEMMRDCRANLPEGWSYCIAHYVPVLRRLLARYGTEKTPALEAIVAAMFRPQSTLFQSIEPSPERWFVAELRQKALAEMAVGEDAPADMDLEMVGAALASFTVVEKEVAWLETMHYDGAQAAGMLRMSPETASKIRQRSADQIRGQVNVWNREILEANGASLGRAAAAAITKDCPTTKPLTDVLDGRATWSEREALERHFNTCWYCIDHYCRLLEVGELLRGIEILPANQTEPFLEQLGVRAAKPAGWKRWLGKA